MMLKDELLSYLFSIDQHSLMEPMANWLASSRRFTAFVNDHHDKIRKKIRSARDTESTFDLRLELETAYLLLRENTLHVVYEPLLAAPGRSPDFLVSYTTSFTFSVEVTRMRAAQANVPQSSLPGQAELAPRSVQSAGQPQSDRFADMIGSKLGQLLPARANMLVTGIDAETMHPDGLQAVMLHLQQRAENNDAGVIQRHGFRGRADFFRYYQRLSAMLVRRTIMHPGAPLAFWVNPQAKIPLPGKARTAILRSHAL